MALLDSFLAFVLTLAVLATVVTILMEIAIRVCGLKRKGQVQLFIRLFDKAVKKHLPAEASRWDVVRAILENPFAAKKMAAAEGCQKYPIGAAGGIYNEVSLEHILRRLMESDAAAELLSETKKELTARLQAIAQKYDELSSALAADFKRRAQMWSLFGGIALALVLNVDGVRLLQTYLEDPALRQSVIEELQIPEQSQAATGDEQQEPKDDVEADIEKLKKQLAVINELGLPIGAAYFPHCLLPWESASRTASVDPLCKTDDAKKSLSEWLLWFLKVVVTGMLIGLGAPFWYDVARRLAAVRTAFGGTPPREARHSGENGTAKPADRKDLIDRIATDVLAASKPAVGNGASTAPQQPAAGS